MTLSKELDLAIKFFETKTPKGEYWTPNGLKYETYMTNSEWDSFKSNMSVSARDEYEAGGGDELTEKGGRPPKMACYGSSSRMIYTLSYQKENFHFEKKLPTTVGGTANLDGFFEESNRYVFVEAKCHEPYSKKASSVSTAYKELYDYINENMPDSLFIQAEPTTNPKLMKVEYIAEWEKLEYFDLKQLICHLLGIATAILQGKLEQKQIDFIYLLYDPTELELASDTKEKIDSIYERICYECNLVDVAALFRAVLSYLNEKKYGYTLSSETIEQIAFRFTFTLASQDFYPILIQ